MVQIFFEGDVMWCLGMIQFFLPVKILEENYLSSHLNVVSKNVHTVKNKILKIKNIEIVG